MLANCGFAADRETEAWGDRKPRGGIVRGGTKGSSRTQTDLPFFKEWCGGARRGPISSRRRTLCKKGEPKGDVSISRLANPTQLIKHNPRPRFAVFNKREHSVHSSTYSKFVITQGLLKILFNQKMDSFLKRKRAEQVQVSSTPMAAGTGREEAMALTDREADRSARDVISSAM